MGERGDDGEGLFKDLRRWKVPESEIAKLRAQQQANAKDSVIEVEPENRDTVRVFMRATSQWRGEAVVAGKHLIRLRTGLDYGVLPTIAMALGVRLDEQLLDGVRVMEGAALDVHARRQEAILQRR